MKIAMIGSGAAGSVFAAYLKRGGADLYLVDQYKAHMDKITADGLVLRESGRECRLSGFHTASDAGELPVMELVILMVKCTQTREIMPSVMPCIGPETVVVSLQNGLCNEECITPYVERERLLLGFGKIGTELPEPGVCVAKPEPGTVMYFGAAAPSPLTERAGRELERLFLSGGCRASFVDDIQPYIWRKAIANCGYNAVSAVLGLPVGLVLRSESGSAIVRQVWQECCAVAEARGIHGLAGEMEHERERLLQGFSDYYPSMAQDIIRRRQTEIAHMNGAIARFGRELGVPTPVNQLITDMILTMQSNYEYKK